VKEANRQEGEVNATAFGKSLCQILIDRALKRPSVRFTADQKHLNPLQGQTLLDARWTARASLSS
jgi:hypothetical protein